MCLIMAKCSLNVLLIVETATEVVLSNLPGVIGIVNTQFVAFYTFSMLVCLVKITS